jgi:telomere length regulation protein
MTEGADAALRELRETLRSAIPDTDTFTFSLSTALQAIHLHPTSVPPSHVPEEIFRAIDRYIPAIQISLLNQALPTFLHALNDGERRLVKTFFCPNRDATTLPIARSVALATYQTIPPLLSSTQITPLPTQSREFAMDMLAAVVDTYSIDDLYWAIWGAQTQVETSSSGEKSDGVRTLRWEETVKALVGVPAKAANAVGRWKQEGWSGDVSKSLQPR